MIFFYYEKWAPFERGLFISPQGDAFYFAWPAFRLSWS
jgi:hypothetical protein